MAVRIREQRALVCTSLALLALACAGCGGSGSTESVDGQITESSTTPARTPDAPSAERERQDSDSKINVRNAVTNIESCYVDTIDYRDCDRPRNWSERIPTGPGPGQVEVQAHDQETYTVVGHSESGNDFSMSRRKDGTFLRVCTAKVSGGGCERRHWLLQGQPQPLVFRY